MSTILFLHGALGAASQFDSIIAKLRAHYHCVALDFPMHGNNEMKCEFSIQGFAEYLINYIEENKLNGVAVFGFSMGGYVALYAASKRPELFSGIMTLATKLKWNEDIANKAKSMMDTALMQQKVPHFVQQLIKRHLHIDWKILVNNTADLLVNIGNEPLLTDEIFTHLKMPIQLGIGDKDYGVSIEETAHAYRQLENGNMYILPNTKEPFEKVNEALLIMHIRHFFATN